tara:strand:- start:12223 stop:12453 length:231 start_codon:yes stop_codon:yes gene_type:complete
MIGDDEIKEMHEQVRAMEKELSERKKQLHQAKYASLREAINARKEADDLVKQELKALGISSFTGLNPFTFDTSWRF